MTLATLILITSLHSQEFVSFLGGSVIGNTLTTSLLAFWRFEEVSGNAFDSSGNGRTLTQHGTPTSGLGIVGNARGYAVAGTDYFDRATEAAFAFGGGQFTIAAWAFFNAKGVDPNDMSVLSRGDYMSANFSWWLVLDHGTPNDTMYFYYSTTGSFDASKFVAYPLVGEIGTGFNFIAVRWNGTVLHISVTNYLQPSIQPDQTTAFSGTIFAGTPTLQVGIQSGDAIHNMGGTLDEIGIWSIYLSDCQLNWLYTARLGSFTSLNFNALACHPL